MEPGPSRTFNIVSTQYNGLTTTTTRFNASSSNANPGANARSQTSVNNAIGQTVFKQEEEGTHIRYTYNSDGSLLTTEVDDDPSTLIRLHYDEFGRKVQMDDPDMGTWRYTYDAFGNLKTQTDAKGQIVTMEYDLLNRMTSRTEPEGQSTWVYGNSSAPAGSIGQLLTESGLGVTRNFSYDRLGRVISSTMHIDQQGSFTTETTYDGLGRVKRINYPGDQNFFTENMYNENGFLYRVRGSRTQAEQPTLEDPSLMDLDANFITYWQATDVDASGRISAEVYGNGIVNDYGYNQATGHLEILQSHLMPSQPIRRLEYVYDGFDNVEDRDDIVNSIQEHYDYDKLDRLVTSNINSQQHTGTDFNSTVTVQYDTLGNILQKSDVGQLSLWRK